MNSIVFETMDNNELKISLIRDFPPIERIPFFLLKRSIAKGWLFAKCAYDGDKKIGYVVYTKLKKHNIVHILYFAIFPENRGQGYGTDFLSAFKNHIGGVDIILEVEDPYEKGISTDDKKIRKSRIKFYNKSGLDVVPGVKYSSVGYYMLIMQTGSANIESYKELFKKVYKRVLGFKFLTYFMGIKEE